MGASQSSTAPSPPNQKVDVSQDWNEYVDLMNERDRLRKLRENAIQKKQYSEKERYDYLLAVNREKLATNPNGAWA